MSSRSGTTVRRLGYLALVCVGLAGCLPWFSRVEPAPGSPSREDLTALFSAARVVEERPYQAGYDRGCKEGQGCVFGPAWSDATDAPGGRDGCDTRNNVLAHDLRSPEFRPGTHDCVVTFGLLDDPYTGETVTYRRGADGGGIEIDHIYPLSAAWHMGAHAWPLADRMRFANDVAVNLLATGSAANQAKADGTPGTWLPGDPSRHCYYAGRYLTAAVSYQLPITRADQAALRRVIAQC